MKLNLGMPPYWRGGVPTERGDYPAALEFRPQREKTDNPEIFQGWIADIEIVLASAGLSLVTQQTGGGTVIFSAAGHKVAEAKKTMSGFEGTVYSRPVGGPGPGIRGQMAAEQIRRSSTWLGYGQPMHTQSIRTALAPTTTPEYHLAPEAAASIRTVESRIEEIVDPGHDLYRQAVQEQYDSGTKQLAIGGAVGALGIIGGSVLALAGKGLGTGVKVMAGVASAASGIGGGIVGVRGYKKRAEAAPYIRRLEELDDMMGGGPMTADRMSALAQLDANFYRTTPRPHPAVAAEQRILSKNVPKPIADEMRARGGIVTKVQGLTIEDIPRLAGHPVWAEVGHVEAQGRDVTVCSPASCADPISGREVWLHLKDTSGAMICRVRAHRYRGDTWNYGWMPGLFDKSSRQCWGCTTHEGSKAPVIWENGYDNFEGSGAPPAGFYMRASSNSWLNDVIRGQNLGSAELPTAGGLASEKAKIRGPMGAVMQSFRALRAASPEVTMMYWPGTWDMMQMLAATAKIHDARAWWMKVGSWIGTLFGVASFVCEVATPIISCINPAVGAAVGLGMSAAISAGQRVAGMVEGLPGGVLDVIGNLGLTATDLQGLLREPLDPVRDFSDDVGSMVQGWLDSNGLFAGTIGDLGAGASDIITDVFNPATQYRAMIGQVYELASSNIQRTINLRPASEVPFFVDKMTSFSQLPKMLEGAPFPMPDPREYYRLP